MKLAIAPIVTGAPGDVILTMPKMFILRIRSNFHSIG